MSAYSEWKYGLITDAEYSSACREEEYRDKWLEEHGQDEDEFDESEVFIDDDIDEF